MAVRPDPVDDRLTLPSFRRMPGPGAVACRPLRRRRHAIALALAFSSGAAPAATFVVSTTDDSGSGSLRQAILDANAAGGANTITFALGSAAPYSIVLSSQLPGIAGSLLVDGYSQDGSAPNTSPAGGLDTQLGVEVVGAGGPGFWLQTGSASLTVQGLALHGFSDAISGWNGGAGASQVFVYGNFIGTALEGGPLPGGGNGNGGCAVRSGFSSATIGGSQPWQRNLLSGNGGAGVFASGPVVIEGNLIGTDAAGASAIPNGAANNWGGLIIGTRSHVRIGGSDAASRNVISGNVPVGIGLWASFGPGGAVSDFVVAGNWIGTDASGLASLPNGFAAPNAAQFGGGIQIQGGDGSALPIGGFGPGEANLIAWNRGAGIIAANNGNGEAFDDRGNVVHHNRGVGRVNIDIGNAGPTPNDADDADAGSNRTQNSPVIIAATLTGDQLGITYRVDTAVANASWPLRVDFRTNVAGGAGTWLGSDSYPSSSAGQARSITLTVPAGLRALPFVASATDATGLSSELSSAWDVLFEDDFD